MPVTVQCKLCGSGFDVKPSDVGRRVYCSKKCMSEAYRGEKRQLVCETCGKPFEVPDRPSRLNARFCSKECMGKGQSGENHWNYQHGLGRHNPEKQKARFQKHYQENKDSYMQRAFLHKIKRRQIDVEGSHSFLEWIDLLKKHNNECYYCGVRMTKKMGPRQRTRDHIIPITRGGKDDLSNIVPACRSCNSSKGDRNLDEWKRVTVIETTSIIGRKAVE